MKDIYTPFYILIGITYLKSVDPKYNDDTKNDYRKLLDLLVEQLKELKK